MIKPGAIEELSAMVADWNSIVVIADKNTYAVCGEAVIAQLGDKLESKIVFECDGFLVPNENAIEKAQALLSDKTDLIIGIGAGVIQDLAKYVSFYASLPYFIVATAPSMDGYASVGATMYTTSPLRCCARQRTWVQSFSDGMQRLCRYLWKLLLVLA